MSPAFSPKHLNLVSKATVSKTRELMAKLSPGQVHDMRSLFSAITLDVLGLIMYSVDFGSLDESNAPAMKAVTDIVNGSFDRFRYPRFMWPFLKSNESGRKLIKDTVLQAISRKAGQVKREDDMKDMIDILLEEATLDSSEIVDEVNPVDCIALTSKGSYADVTNTARMQLR